MIEPYIGCTDVMLEESLIAVS